jgi:hypothetical protein
MTIHNPYLHICSCDCRRGILEHETKKFKKFKKLFEKLQSLSQLVCEDCR